MKWDFLRRRIHNKKMNRFVSIRRYNHIISVFAKHGFGLLMDQLGILNYLKIRKRLIKADTKPDNSKLTTGERLRRVFEELGPTFIKLGQILSTRPDVIPADILDELKKLQDSVHPFPFSEVRSLIEAEFEDKLENIFKEFDEEPVAAASISQVHRARLGSGKLVAVKVQRPEIEKPITVDISILKDLAHFIDNHTRYGKTYEFSSLVSEFENTLKNELDFTREAGNADIFRHNFSKDKSIRVPDIKWMYTTKRILTMEYIEGMRIDDREALIQSGIEIKTIAEKLAATMCNQILKDGFFHADPHPGNIRILIDGTIVFLDLGMVGRLSEKRKMIISRFFIGVTNKDSKMVVRSLIDLDTMPRRSNLKKFQRDVDKIIDKYLAMPWNELKIGDLFHDIFSIALVNQIKIPREFAMLSKTLATLQGLLEMLDPKLNALVLVEPLARKLMYQSFSLKNVGNDLKKSLMDYKDLIREFPSVMSDFLGKMEEGDFSFQFEIKDIDHIQKRFERVFNRLSISVVLLAVSIVIAGIIIGSGMSAGAGNEIYLLNVTILKVALAIVVLIILGLLYSIFRSSRL